MATNVVTEIPTPVNTLWRDILLIPIFGVLDSNRAQSLLETMLEKVLATGSKVIILDILGVATVDTAVANHLVHITKASKLMGCAVIITGISPSIAQTLVHLGVELTGVITTATLANGLELAFDNLGLEVRTKGTAAAQTTEAVMDGKA